LEKFMDSVVCFGAWWNFGFFPGKQAFFVGSEFSAAVI
jgi:hypothetical protein